MRRVTSRPSQAHRRPTSRESLLSVIAEDEGLMKRAVKYLRKLVAEKEADPTLMTEEEFFAKIKRGEEAYERGEYTVLEPGESVTDMLRRNGYDI